MNVRDEAREMLMMGEKDLRAMRGMIDRQYFDDEVFGFHAQQAVEKSLKAWIIAVDEEYPITHSIARLLDVLEKSANEVSSLRQFDAYSPFAVAHRYQAAGSAHVVRDRPAVIAQVSALWEHVKAVIEGT